MIYASTIFDLHSEGGKPFMWPLTLLLFTNICLILYVSIKLFQKREFFIKRLEAIKQIGGLAAAWGTLSTIVGLSFAFDALENSPEVIPFQVIMGGMKVATISVIYGLSIYCISLVAYIVLKMAGNKS